MEAGSSEGKMSTWPKPPQSLVEAFGEAARPLPGVEARKMFGCPCAFLNGNMFAGVFADRVFFRLAPSDREAFLTLPDAAVFQPMGGRPMREYVQTSADMATMPAEWTPWLDKALAYAATLPPKPEKPPKKPKKS
jgi:TfoX/Sxy family transcriptional regulator of competence genes